VDIGKLTNEELREIVFSNLPKLSDRTMIGANIGSDCAWIDLGEQILVSSSDPITAGGKQSGTLAVHVSCNDISASGIRPIGILIVLLAPAGTEKHDIESIVCQASVAAETLGVDIVGGHTEVTESVRSFVVTSTAFGIIPKSEPFVPGKARPGDRLLMTKTAAIEGTWIIAMNHSDKLNGLVSDPVIQEARSLIHKISVVEEGALLGKFLAPENESGAAREENTLIRRKTAVTLMHDATEGGILGAAYEMAEYSGIGLHVYPDRIPLHPATLEMCSALKIDPLRLISSGSLLISTPYDTYVRNLLISEGIPCEIIGEFTESDFSLIDSSGNISKYDPPSKDHVYKL